MSKHSPYEETDQQFDDLPVPDEEASWQKMKSKLEEEDDRRILPPLLLRSCLGWGFLLLAGLIIAWFIIRPEQRWSENSHPKQTSSSSKENNGVKISTHSLPETKTTTVPLNQTEKSNKEIVSGSSEKVSLFRKPLGNQIKKKNASLPMKTKEKALQRSQPVYQNERNQATAYGVTDVTTNNKHKKDSVVNSNEVDNSIQQDQTSGKDTAKKENAVPTDTVQKKINSTPKKLFLMAGIGEQQQIPIAGQTAVPYSHYGRRGSLSDYVPSVYLQLQKEKKWFIQAEFRYGAAQSVKEFSYSRKTKLDPARMNVTTTTERLKKTYYHQLPLSFNYYLRPNLSVGLGGIYSRFYGAITEREVETQNLQTGAQSVLKQIIPIKHFTDSFLYKTQVHVLVQADYEWKQFSFGLRYTKDIQPYIKYTRPDGTIDEEKNQSLQLLVRYRLWQSKKS